MASVSVCTVSYTHLWLSWDIPADAAPGAYEVAVTARAVEEQRMPNGVLYRDADAAGLAFTCRFTPVSYTQLDLNGSGIAVQLLQAGIDAFLHISRQGGVGLHHRALQHMQDIQAQQRAEQQARKHYGQNGADVYKRQRFSSFLNTRMKLMSLEKPTV